MNKQQAKMEQMVALVWRAFTLGVLVGEDLRDLLYGTAPHGQKWKLYSGLFILLKQKMTLTTDQVQKAIRDVLERFRVMVQHPVRTYV